jgi:hypothetical protein
MNKETKERYEKANKLIRPHLPRIEKALGGELVLVEMGDSRVSRLLDQKAGIDAYLVQNHHIKSIALRLLTPKKLYKNYTIRSHSYHTQNTELSKIPKLIKDNATYPNLTLQINISKEGEWMGAGCIYTKDLYQFVEDNNMEVMSRERANGDGSRFVWVGWGELSKAGYKLRLF